MKSVFAISEQYEGVATTFGVFTTKALAEQALEDYLDEYPDLETRSLIAKGMYVEEIELVK
jgi:hypothetical protein